MSISEVVIIQERGAVSAVFTNQFFKGIPRDFIHNKDAECATGENNFSNISAESDIVTHMKFVAVGIGEACVEAFLCHFIRCHKIHSFLNFG